MALADQLRSYLQGKPSGKPVWTIPDKTARMIRADLEAAGVDYQDDAGRYGDFHSLRHSYVSALTIGGVAPRVAQSLARHSTITLTMDRNNAYLSMGDAAKALDALPDLSPRKTGNRSPGTPGDGDGR